MLAAGRRFWSLAFLPAALVAQPPVAPSPGTLHDAREIHLADVRQLTHGVENAEAYWSPDGRQLIFQSTRPPLQCDQIFTLPVDGSAPAKMVSTGLGRTTCSYFTAAGDRILFASTHLYARGCPPPPDFSQGYVWRIDPDYEIFTARPDGSDLARLTENRAYDAEATVCPLDGTILFTSTRDGDLDLYTMKPDGSQVKRITDAPGYDGGGYFSRDCKQIVWRASRPRGEELAEYRKLLAADLVRPGKLELWVANADGSDAHQVTRLGVASFAPYFYPDGRRIIFSSNYGDPRGREFDLWAIDVAGTRLERITYTAGFDGFPMFSPDGKSLVFASNRNQGKPGETDIYVARWLDAPGTYVADRAEDRFVADDVWLADDARQGRGIGTQGLADAAAYLERRFSQLGLAPAGVDGGYRQTFSAAVGAAIGGGTRLAVDGADLPAGDFAPASFSGLGTMAGPVVFAGYGITAPDKQVDDYQGLDVKGKVALVRRFVPPGPAFAAAEDERRWSDLRYKAYNAREHGAIGVLFADLPEAVEGQPIPEEAPLPKLVAESRGDAGLPALSVKRALAERLAAKGGRVEATVDLVFERAQADNVIARLDPPAGAPPASDVVVVGAHYDHLGMGGPGSLAPDEVAVHNGADDNGSGTAALLEVARELAARRAEITRPVVFIAFAGEERGLLGSSAWAREPTGGVTMKNVAAMINMDMVGRLRGQKLTIFGTETAEEWDRILSPLCAAAQLECVESGDGYGPSDQTSFYAAGVPVLHFFTGTHDDYHKPGDDADKILGTGGAIVAGLVADVALAVDTRTAPLSFHAATSPPPAAGDVRSFGASLGTVPDYSGPPAGKTGVPIAAVRPGGPAEKAGMKRGDLLVGLAGKQIRDLEDFMFILRSAKPGQKTTVVVERDGQRLELEVVLGESRRRN
ncbi:MAG: M28 family peptidase [Thermoanaerobaculia bacterium]